VVTFLADDDCDDHAVDAEDTGHDDWDKRFHDHGWLPDGDTADAGPCLGCTVCCPQVCINRELLASTRAMLTPMNPKKDDPFVKSASDIYKLLIYNLNFIYIIS